MKAAKTPNKKKRTTSGAVVQKSPPYRIDLFGLCVRVLHANSSVDAAGVPYLAPHALSVMLPKNAPNQNQREPLKNISPACVLVREYSAL